MNKFNDNLIDKNSVHHVHEYFEIQKNKGNIKIENTLLTAYQFLPFVKEPTYNFKILGLNCMILEN